MKKTKKSPDLRFQEFRDEWSKRKLGEIFQINAGGDIRKENVSPFKTGEFKYPVYANAEKNKGFYGYSNIFTVEPGTVTVAGRGVNIGIAHARNHKFYPIVRLLVLKPRNGENIYFSEYAINRVNWFVESTGVPQLTAPQLAGYKVAFPSITEQQKIASFLSAIDKKIQQLSRKKELLETYKKRVMQKLFSQEIRFKDFSVSNNGKNGKDFPEWEKKKFGDLYSFLTTNSFSRNDLNYKEGIVKNIHYGDIHTKFPNLFHLSKENVPFINSDKDISKISPENYCQEGDLVIADASEDYKDIGKTIEIIDLNSEKVLAGLHTFLARPKGKVLYKGFSGYLVQNWNFRKQVMTIAQGTKVLGLSTGRMKKLKIEIPSIPEQQKIADLLSVIDKKIEAVSQQIEKTKSFKKGLLQQMFV